MAGSDAASTAGLSAEIASDRDYRRLARASGAEFDEEYVDLTVDQHERDVQLFQKTARNAEDSEVRQFASAHLSKLQAHLDRANNLMKSAAE
jgi:putative membrane protein